MRVLTPLVLTVVWSDRSGYNRGRLADLYRQFEQAGFPGPYSDSRPNELDLPEDN
jgi:hypothetical protein